MIKILINVQGGVIQGVCTTDPDVVVVVVDYDRKPEEESVAYLEAPTYYRRLADAFNEDNDSEAEKQALAFCEMVDTDKRFNKVTDAFGFGVIDVLNRINGDEDNEDDESVFSEDEDFEPITEDDAHEILEIMIDQADMSAGVSWDDIDNAYRTWKDDKKGGE
jgi:hypothetical protein